MHFVRIHGRVIPIRDNNQVAPRRDPHDSAKKVATAGAALGGYIGLSRGSLKGISTRISSKVVNIRDVARPMFSHKIMSVQKTTLIHSPTLLKEGAKGGLKGLALGALVGASIGVGMDMARKIKGRKQK